MTRLWPAFRSARYLAAEFIAHALSNECLFEHGGGVAGSWLTDRGKQFVEIGSHDLDDHPLAIN
ncbi:hypothetical protein [Sinorhizobium medicae]|uniref:hypothetical protein n=1 Tax=Sinorhizobium medicae TaxID=110321 RepID=UPI001294F954|nr:hypothetical protein [Sinorhizobium medicae]MQX45746.1 hypothetical protein [Sinorhizobium medicae]